MLILSSAAKLAHPDTAKTGLATLFDGSVLQAFVQANARNFVFLVSLLEWCGACALIVFPDSPYPAVAVSALAAAFASLGVYAKAVRRPVECGCLGSIHSFQLGWVQVIQFFAITALLLASRFHATAWGVSASLGILLVCHVAAAAVLLAAIAPTWRAIKGQRISLAEGASFYQPANSQTGRGL